MKTIMKQSCRYFLFTIVACHMSMVANNLMSMFLESPFPSSSHVASCSKNSVYIPGAGFSGFFYTLGRLSSLSNETRKTGIESPYEYYCFSSGCLALVAHLLGRNVDSALELAHESRNQFISGNIGPYSIVGKFVDGLLFGDAETDAAVHLHYEGSDQCSTNHTASNAIHQLHGHLSRINVITTSWNEANIPAQSIRSPSNVDQLRQMLIQTTWIPFVTGSSFFEEDYHNDGGFAIVFGFKGLQQNCYSLIMPWRIDLMSNFLNLFLSHDRAKYFWVEGLKRGID